MSKHRSVANTVKDPTLEFATLTIDNETFSLCYSFNSIAEAENASGCNLLRGLESLMDMTALQLRGLLYAAMIIAHPEITIQAAGHLIRLDTIAQVTTALGLAYSLSMPKKKDVNLEPENDSSKTQVAT